MAMPLDKTVLLWERLPAVAVTDAGATLTLTEEQLHGLVRIRFNNLGPQLPDFAQVADGTAMTFGENDRLAVDSPMIERVRARTWGFICDAGQTASVNVAIEREPTL